VANATRENWRALNTHHNFTTIHNGLDAGKLSNALGTWPRAKAREQLNIPSDAIAVLIVGTVCERKGQIDLLKAVARLSEEQVRQLRCFIVGDRESNDSQRLHWVFEGLPPTHQSCITIVPETSETALYYSSADIFVCASKMESYPRVILEAMAAGLPIITTPIFGVCEQVQENVNALFFQPGDAQTLADSIVRLSTDHDFRLKLAGNSRFVLSSLTNYEEMVSSYAKIFRAAWLSGRTRTCVES
jgi:glycosyltransferase involved in cell wall biosynthesis